MKENGALQVVLFDSLGSVRQSGVLRFHWREEGRGQIKNFLAENAHPGRGSELSKSSGVPWKGFTQSTLMCLHFRKMEIAREEGKTFVFDGQ